MIIDVILYAVMTLLIFLGGFLCGYAKGNGDSHRDWLRAFDKMRLAYMKEINSLREFISEMGEGWKNK